MAPEARRDSEWSIRPPLDIVGTSEFFADFVPPLGAEDDSSIYTRRLSSYRSIRRVWCAIILWLLLLAAALTQAKVVERDISLDVFLNKTLFPNLEQHWSRINESMQNSVTQDSRHKKPGEVLAHRGAKPKYPIVMVPGFVTSALELWEGESCAKKYFRQRMWGALGTARGFFTDKQCWLKHLSLDPLTGSDPEGIRLRAAQGFEAADYFMTAYWVWNKLIDNLAAIGYDGSNMSMESYDWRLAFPMLEERDGFFTKLQYKIEAMHKTNGEKVVLASHSMGSLVLVYFFKWVTTPEKHGGGGGGKKWVDEHVHATVNIAGPLLGVPKAVTSIMSGEMKDTNVIMGAFGSMLEQFFGRRLRKEIWSSWGSLWAMLPKGGDEIWGAGADMCSSGSAPNGIRCSHDGDESQESAFIEFTDQEGMKECSSGSDGSNPLTAHIDQFSSAKRKSVDETLRFLRDWGVGLGAHHVSTRMHSFEKRAESSPRTWSDPSQTSLPDAPSMKMFCLYGVGIKTERAFSYKINNEFEEVKNQCVSSPVDLPFIMDGTVESEDEGIEYGVKMVDGDGSVPLLSLGYMCVDGWMKKHLNPSGIQIVTREYQHEHQFSVDDPMRGGPLSADHVDILGNIDMTMDFLRIVTDFEEESVQTNLVSDIEHIAQRINQHPLGGLKSHQAQANPLRSLARFVETSIRKPPL